MREFVEKRRKKSKFYSYPVLIVVILVLIFFLKINISMYHKVKESAEKREQVENQLNELRDRRNELQKEVERLSTQIGVEEELRTRFNLMKENEEMIVILEDEKSLINSDLDQNQKTFWGKIKGWFGF